MSALITALAAATVFAVPSEATESAEEEEYKTKDAEESAEEEEYKTKDAEDDADARAKIPPWHRRSPWTPSPTVVDSESVNPDGVMPHSPESPMPYSPPSPIPSFPRGVYVSSLQQSADSIPPVPSASQAAEGSTTVDKRRPIIPHPTLPIRPITPPIPISGSYNFLVNPPAPRADAEAADLVLMPTPCPVVLIPTPKAMVKAPPKKRPKLTQTPKTKAAAAMGTARASGATISMALQ